MWASCRELRSVTAPAVDACYSVGASQHPVTVVQNPPASTLNQALANAKKVVDTAAKK
jgi:hypothetical protein